MLDRTKLEGNCGAAGYTYKVAPRLKRTAIDYELKDAAGNDIPQVHSGNAITETATDFH